MNKLDVIDALYPPQRIAASKERLQRMWDGKRHLDRYPCHAASITELDEGSWDIMYSQDKELKALATCCADLYRQ